MPLSKKKLGSHIRDALPPRYQVPLKYYYNWVKASLEPEMKLLKYLVSKGSRVIDVGGNRGIYAYYTSRLGAEVDVFEPNPMCANILKAWAIKLPNVTVHAVGLSASESSRELHIPIDEYGVEHDASASVEDMGVTTTRDQLVSLNTLDSFRFENVNFIKIDVEGHESSVIGGSKMLLSSLKPALLVEIEQRHNAVPITQVFQNIMDFGYEGFFLRKNKLVSLKVFDVSCHQSLHNFNLSKGEYINNFLFLHTQRIGSGEYSELISRFQQK